jgi:hypothetical protein
MIQFNNADLLIIKCPDCNQTIYIRLYQKEDGSNIEFVPIATDAILPTDTVIGEPDRCKDYTATDCDICPADEVP